MGDPVIEYIRGNIQFTENTEEDMGLISDGLRYLPLLAAGIFAIGGTVIDGVGSGILGALIGYFLAKAFQSTVWTFQAHRTA
jgi:hypothetical protein